MRKLFAGVLVLIVFAVYSLAMRHHDPVIGKPSSLVTTAGNSGGSTQQTSQPPSTSTNQGPPVSAPATYKDGTYTGSVADAFYGNVQVQATISGGKITNVKFLQYPDTHSTSVMINQQAMPYLIQEAVQAQNSNVQIVSGATFTSQAFQQSLQAALNQA